MCKTGHNNMSFTNVEQNLHGNTLSHTWDTLIFLKTAYFKHSEDFPTTEIFEKLKFVANLCEYV